MQRILIVGSGVGATSLARALRHVAQFTSWVDEKADPVADYEAVKHLIIGSPRVGKSVCDPVPKQEQCHVIPVKQTPHHAKKRRGFNGYNKGFL